MPHHVVRPSIVHGGSVHHLRLTRIPRILARVSSAAAHFAPAMGDGVGGPTAPIPDVVGTYVPISADGRPSRAPFGDSTVFTADGYFVEATGTWTHEGRSQGRGGESLYRKQ